jgi:hypothetical protein
VAFVFGAFCRERPSLALQVHLVPAHSTNLIQALCGENEQLDDGAKGISSFFCGLPNFSQFVVVQNTSAIADLTGRFKALAGIFRYFASFHTPIKELPDVGKCPVSTPEQKCISWPE